MAFKPQSVRGSPAPGTSSSEDALDGPRGSRVYESVLIGLMESTSHYLRRLLSLDGHVVSVIPQRNILRLVTAG
jgi:hypothetical protein